MLHWWISLTPPKKNALGSRVLYHSSPMLNSRNKQDRMQATQNRVLKFVKDRFITEVKEKMFSLITSENNASSTWESLPPILRKKL